MIGIVTVSDTRTQKDDRSGPEAEETLRKLGFTSFQREIVQDDVAAIQNVICLLCETCEAVFTTGGTGFAPRDVTPEATLPLLERLAPNLTELMRLKGLEHTPLSHLSRGVAGVRGRTLIVNLPGSPAGAREGIEALGPLLGSILSQLSGGVCEH